MGSLPPKRKITINRVGLFSSDERPTARAGAAAPSYLGRCGYRSSRSGAAAAAGVGVAGTEEGGGGPPAGTCPSDRVFASCLMG